MKQFMWKQASRMPCVNVRAPVAWSLKLLVNKAANTIYIAAAFAAKELKLIPMNKIHYEGRSRSTVS